MVDGEPRLLKQHAHALGYRMVNISYSDKKVHVKNGSKDVFHNYGDHRQIGVHRIVADAFMGPCPLNHEVNHKDLNKKNNLPGNLEYVTHKENLEHAVRLRGNWMKGRPCFWKGKKMPVIMRVRMSEAKRGAKHWRARHVDPDEIKRLYDGGNGMIMQAIADKLGVSRTCVGDVIRGTHWTVGGHRTNRKFPKK